MFKFFNPKCSVYDNEEVACLILSIEHLPAIQNYCSCRYTTFYILYPTGICSEAGLIFVALPFMRVRSMLPGHTFTSSWLIADRLIHQWIDHLARSWQVNESIHCSVGTNNHSMRLVDRKLVFIHFGCQTSWTLASIITTRQYWPSSLIFQVNPYALNWFSPVDFFASNAWQLENRTFLI